ncbi:hypothetical protein D5H75_20000 [Bailinhaonella thermotolerans]|uniref:ATP-citrate synthase/succinyl-CoA ligase C-terminal domain-containing protein n=1 Tax=Bailinhaonella thermotolerans TaxID=1070861 RepID=A0A3A4AQV1_9ACTN|nr:hypothetical protein D5H75_20000 [Bailinhaonella thermotolerans]
MRGLFAGGTLCAEAELIAREALGEAAGSFTDFGDDAFTRGRPHPMIDPGPRLERLAADADDPACGVLLLDVVLGHAAEEDPAARLAPLVTRARRNGAHVVISLCGARGDPQDLARQARALNDAGAAVFASNAAAARHAALLATPAKTPSPPPAPAPPSPGEPPPGGGPLLGPGPPSAPGPGGG